MATNIFEWCISHGGLRVHDNFATVPVGTSDDRRKMGLHVRQGEEARAGRIQRLEKTKGARHRQTENFALFQGRLFPARGTHPDVQITQR